MGPFILLIILGLLGWLAASGSLSLTGAWAVTIFLGTLSLVMIAVNPIAGVLTHRRGESCSLVPFFGGLFGVVPLLSCPIHGARSFAWVPLILDLSFPMLLYAVFVLRIFGADPDTRHDTRTGNGNKK